MIIVLDYLSIDYDYDHRFILDCLVRVEVLYVIFHFKIGLGLVYGFF